MQIKTAQITPFGGMIEIPLHKHSWQESLVVIMAGGAVNLVIAVLLCAVWWFFPITYGITYSFARANIIIALVNFLPCYPLDGGRVAYLWCKEVLNLKGAERLISLSGIAIGCVFMLLFILNPINITTATLGVFMILGSEKTLKNISQISAMEKWNMGNSSLAKNGIAQQNILVVDGETKVYKAFFHFKKGGENILKIKLKKGDWKVVSQAELHEEILRNSNRIDSQTTFSVLFS